MFDQATGRMKKAISLVPRGAGGGNLVLGEGHLLIATDDELIAFGRGTPSPKKPEEELARSAATTACQTSTVTPGCGAG